MDADVRDMTTGADQFGTQLERRRYTDGFDRDVGAEPVCQRMERDQGIFAPVVDHDVGAELLGGLEQLSVATGDEESTFATAMGSAGVEPQTIAHLAIADTTDQYALLVDNIDVFGGTYQTAIRYDLVSDVAINLGVPAQLLAPPTAPCAAARRLALSDDGDVIVIDTTTDMVSGAPESPGTGAIAAKWHDGGWSSEPAALAGSAAIRPGFACDANASDRLLQGVDEFGVVQWTDPDLTHPGADDIAWYRDGDMAIGQVCSQRSGDECQRFELVGVETATGHVRWVQPGLRLVAANPADGYALVWAEPLGAVFEPPGWVLLDDQTGQEVAGQRWDAPETFTLHPSREVAGFNTTARAGGLLLVVKDNDVQVWYPKRTGGVPRTLSLP